MSRSWRRRRRRRRSASERASTSSSATRAFRFRLASRVNHHGVASERRSQRVQPLSGQSSLVQFIFGPVCGTVARRQREQKEEEEEARHCRRRRSAMSREGRQA